MRSLRTRLIVASVLWTAGMLMLLHMASLVLMQAIPAMRRFRSHGPVAVGFVLMASGFWIARGSLVHLRRLRETVVAVRRGAGSRIAGEYPREVEPLVESLNELIEDREKAVERARAVAGDLAHGLKTPLALLAREADAARAGGNSALAASIDEQVARMSKQVDYQLARARAAAAGSAGAAGCSVRPCAEALIRTLGKLHAERALSFTVNVAEPLEVRVRLEDLEEILGNLLDNAAKWARTSVSISARLREGAAELIVEDDGPGLLPELRAAVLERGVRADEIAPGSGLGLSIVLGLTRHYGGSLHLGEAAAGGLLARVTLPAL